MPRVLIIDDDEFMRDMLSQMMERAGLAVVRADNGLAGVEKFKTPGCDLVITDIVMPEQEGLQTIMDIGKIDADVPIIAISGGARINPDSYLAMARKFGARYAFRKPFERKELMDAVTECLDLDSCGPTDSP